MHTRYANLLLPYDTYERHTVVAGLLRHVLGRGSLSDVRPISVLDVGGRSGLLQRFTSYRPVAINPDGSGDVLGGGRGLPFAGGSHSAVVSIDTLEHLPSSDRLPFLRECLRVARRCVVGAAPYGSAGHVAHERRLDEQYAALHGEGHPYLREHICHGLPNEDHVRAWVAGLDVSAACMLFAGDYLWQGKLFQRAVLVRGGGLPTRLRWMWDRIRASALLHPVRLVTMPYPEANRFYLLWEKASPAPDP